MDEIPEGWDQGLYEKLSFEKLIECGENKKIDEWNALYLEYLESEWKRLYTEREWDPEHVFELVKRQSDFKRPDFSEKDFQEAISRSVYFGRAHLEGAIFIKAHLERAIFQKAHLEGADFRMAYLDGAYFMNAHLEGAIFINARLDGGADFTNAHLEGAYFINARFDAGAYFINARLERVDFMNARLDGAYFREAHLEGANFRNTHLERAIFQKAHLERVDFRVAHLGGADFSGAHLEGAKFIYSIVDGETLFTENAMDGKTDFTGTGISATRIDPVRRTQLERNIREIQWKKWYGSTLLSLLLTPFVWLFWCLTDYGSSTKRVICVFFAWNIFWAFIYQFLLPIQSSPILENASTTVLHTPDIYTAVMQTNLMVFSITDVATKNLDYPALIFVTVQIVIGYFILAALITRLGIMFQNLSP